MRVLLLVAVKPARDDWLLHRVYSLSSIQRDQLILIMLLSLSRSLSRSSLVVPRRNILRTRTRHFSLKAVVIDSTLFVNLKTIHDLKTTGRGIEKIPDIATSDTKRTVEIEGVTDVLTKYRAKLRMKNFFPTDLDNRSRADVGDAKLLQHTKKIMEKTMNNIEDSPVTPDMDTLLKYIRHRGLHLVVIFPTSLAEETDPDVTSVQTKALLKALTMKPLQIQIVADVPIDETLGMIIQKHKMKSYEVMMISDQNHILSVAKKLNVTTCRFGSKAQVIHYSDKTTYIAEDSDGVQGAIEDNNGVTFLQ